MSKNTNNCTNLSKCNLILLPFDFDGSRMNCNHSFILCLFCFLALISRPAFVIVECNSPVRPVLSSSLCHVSVFCSVAFYSGCFVGSECCLVLVPPSELTCLSLLSPLCLCICVQSVFAVLKHVSQGLICNYVSKCLW